MDRDFQTEPTEDMWYNPQCWQTDTFTYDIVDDMGTHSYPEQMFGCGKDVLVWGSEDCVTWARQVCHYRSIDESQVNLSNFCNYTGEMLSRFSQYDFYALLDRSYGHVFFEEFQKLLERGGLVAASDHTSPRPIEPAASNAYSPWCPQNEDYHITDLSNELTDLSKEFTDFPKDITYLSNELPEDIDIKNVVDYVLSYSDESYVTPEPSPDPAVVADEASILDLSIEKGPFEVPSPASLPDAPDEPIQYPLTPVMSCKDVLEKIKTKSRKRERGPKNWEYLMRLLTDCCYNPKIIRWEDEKAMTFRIVKPDKVAKIWGQRSNKPNLTYDNFARGLRYHYTTGALNAVSERQLVYKCGPKAKRYLQEVLNMKYRTSG